MSKIYGGHTVLGDNLNNAHGKSLRGKIDEYKEKKAIIKASYKDTYFFYLTVFNKDGTILIKSIGKSRKQAPSRGNCDAMLRYAICRPHHEPRTRQDIA